MAVPGTHDLAQERAGVIFMECVCDAVAKNQHVDNGNTAPPDATGCKEMPTMDNA